MIPVSRVESQPATRNATSLALARTYYLIYDIVPAALFSQHSIDSFFSPVRLPTTDNNINATIIFCLVLEVARHLADAQLHSLCSPKTESQREAFIHGVFIHGVRGDKLLMLDESVFLKSSAYSRIQLTFYVPGKLSRESLRRRKSSLETRRG